ncbi:Dynamin-related protein 4C [Heracleum sosnowskyi]|uniref:Dynamin-related protein 4C n=1 Tax=Heracleum sosnowskyi TaxID=360622 RepID=A0AAD8I5V7_9APIA|nr:Dynamin-related protein 4C [Heracleum sosnowskyi]
MIVQENASNPVSGIDESLVSSYNDRIRPLLDAIDKLRDLNVMQEGIQLPTIVVVGEQSSGKSSVLESLAGISLPRGDGICTRVPLVIRLQNHAQSDSLLQLEYLTKVVSTDESNVAIAINLATDEIAGNGKGISHTPLTLVVKKNGVPDLTMIDLPGITRVPVHGQPEDIYEQISDIIMEFIKPKESIILNVLSATVDFPTCESIRMSQLVDKTGERTLAVVTKSDKAPDGLHEKVMADDVKIGLGYVCVRNRIGDESYEEARMKETKLFQAHPLLKKIDKSMVGVPVLAKRLVQIQANIISKCLPDIVKKINMKLNANVSELNNLPQKLSSVAEATTTFMRIVGLSRESLKKLLVRGEFEEYPDDKSMHCTARVAELLDKFSEDIKISSDNNSFLMTEIEVLEETKAIALPNFLPRSAFQALLHLKIKAMAEIPANFIAKVWDYVETVVIAVVVHHCEKYPQFQSHMTVAARNLISSVKEKSTERVLEIVEMEKLAGYTCDPQYLAEWKKHLAYSGNLNQNNSVINLGFFGNINVSHLMNYPIGIKSEAFDLKCRITAYWEVVIKRMVDCIALQLLLSIQRFANGEMEAEIVNEVMDMKEGGIERLLIEMPSVALKRERLNKSISLLKESRAVVAKIMDKIAVSDD